MQNLSLSLSLIPAIFFRIQQSDASFLILILHLFGFEMLVNSVGSLLKYPAQSGGF